MIQSAVRKTTVEPARRNLRKGMRRGKDTSWRPLQWHWQGTDTDRLLQDREGCAPRRDLHRSEGHRGGTEQMSGSLRSYTWAGVWKRKVQTKAASNMEAKAWWPGLVAETSVCHFDITCWDGGQDRAGRVGWGRLCAEESGQGDVFTVGVSFLLLFFPKAYVRCLLLPSPFTFWAQPSVSFLLERVLFAAAGAVVCLCSDHCTLPWTLI